MQIDSLLIVILLTECYFVFGSNDEYEKLHKMEKYQVKNKYEKYKDEVYEPYDNTRRIKVYEKSEGKDNYGYKRHRKSDIICVPLSTASSYKLSRNEECAPYTLNIKETFETISNFNTTLFLALVDYNPDVDFEKASNGTTICVPSLKYKYKLSGPCLSYIMQQEDTFKSLSKGNQGLLINLINANPIGFEGFKSNAKNEKDNGYSKYKQAYHNEEMNSNDKHYKKSFICVPLSKASEYKLSKKEDCAPYVLNIGETLASISNGNVTLFLELLELNPGVNYKTATNGTTICVPSLKYNYKLSGPCFAYQLEKGETFKSISNGDLSLYIDLKNSNPNGYGNDYHVNYIKKTDIKETNALNQYV